ncbi:MAG: hypothetical protein DMF72_21650, partial [Acidobacteria bacterium]
IITRSDLTKSREELQQELKQQNVSDADPRAREKEKDALRDLIDQQLLLQKGKDLGISGDTELVKKLDDLRKQLKLDSLEDLEKEAQKQGVSFEDFKQGIRNQIITQQVISHEVAPKIQITEKEIQDYYDKHKSVQPRSPRPRKEPSRCWPASKAVQSLKMSQRNLLKDPPQTRAANSASSSAARWPRNSKISPSA